MDRLRSDSFDGAGGTSKGERLLAEPILVEALNETRDAANIFAYESAATAGSAPTEADLSCPGLQVGDEVLSVTCKTGGNAVAVAGWDNVEDDELDVDFTSDPGAGKVVVVQVRRATA